MPKRKGDPKSGGRKKGTPNKKRIFVAERLAELNFCVVQNIIILYEQADTPPEIKCKLLNMLLDYSAPKPVFEVQEQDDSYTEAEADEAELVLTNGH